MKLKEFKKKMQKSIFSTAEAHVVAFSDDPKLINLQLHQWKKSGYVTQLKRGLYMFPDAKFDFGALEIAKRLCGPCYFSLEYILSLDGIIPEMVFSYTHHIAGLDTHITFYAVCRGQRDTKHTQGNCAMP